MAGRSVTVGGWGGGDRQRGYKAIADIRIYSCVFIRRKILTIILYYARKSGVSIFPIPAHILHHYSSMQNTIIHRLASCIDRCVFAVLQLPL